MATRGSKKSKKRETPTSKKKANKKEANKKKKAASRPTRGTRTDTAQSDATMPVELQRFLEAPAIAKGRRRGRRMSMESLRAHMHEQGVRPTVAIEKLLESANRLDARPDTAVPEEVEHSLFALKPGLRRFHGVRLALSWFPFPGLVSRCSDRFGYMSSASTRSSTKLPFNVTTQSLLGQLGALMGDPGRDPNPSSHNPAEAGVSTIPAGYTYFGQFVDHDITLDVSSTLDSERDANTVPNMRTPALDLDSLYGRGPGLDPFLYVFPDSGPPTAIKLKTGANTSSGSGGPSSNGTHGGMLTQSSWDVPRIAGTNTAVIGDPRNDENLIVVQFHHAMLRFHNAVVDLLLSVAFAGDIFAEAKRIVTHHYQWAVVNDFLGRVCGSSAVTSALGSVTAPVGSAFRMPVEFSVAAYRFGHSMIRDFYWVNFNFPAATLGQVFEFSRNPRLPVFSNWVVDLNAFFDTGVPVPVNNKARRIDSFMAAGLEALPGFAGLMAVLATRNLRRGLALGLPSGQGMANAFGITPMSSAELESGLPAAEVAVLNSSGGLLLNKTPLWYYILREAAVLGGGNQLGPVGGRIVAETFVRMLKRDASSYLNASGGFAPILPSASPGDFTVADLVTFAGVTQP